jgi:hypothetical protein
MQYVLAQAQVLGHDVGGHDVSEPRACVRAARQSRACGSAESKGTLKYLQLSRF